MCGAGSEVRPAVLGRLEFENRLLVDGKFDLRLELLIIEEEVVEVVCTGPLLSLFIMLIDRLRKGVEPVCLV